MPESGLWRVYAPVWVTAYISDAAGQDGYLEAQQVMGERWSGRVRSEDMQVMEPAPGARTVVTMRRPVLRSEWKDERQAAGQLQWAEEAQAVLAGSDQERELLDFGRRRLRA
jgi:hypothetical protein